jgi:hypothetical protein
MAATEWSRCSAICGLHTAPCMRVRVTATTSGTAISVPIARSWSRSHGRIGEVGSRKYGRSLPDMVASSSCSGCAQWRYTVARPMPASCATRWWVTAAGPSLSSRARAAARIAVRLRVLRGSATSPV